MKILFIITSLRNGGAEHLVADLLPRMKASGHDTELAIFDGSPTYLSELIAKAGITIHILGKGAMNMWNPLHIFRIRSIIKKGNFDIVHTHNSPAQILTALAGVKRMSKFVTTEHNATNRRRNVWWGKMLDCRVYDAYHHIVCVSRQTKLNLLKHTDIDPSKISVIPNGVDTVKFATYLPRPNVEGIPNVPDGSKIIFMAGAFRKQKDQATLIRALKYLPENFILWLAGGWILRGECEKLSVDLGVSHRVFFLGQRNDIPQLLQRADILALSSHYEGMPLSAIECMASGKPFVASDVDGIREIAQGAAVLIPPGNESAWAATIKEISDNTALAASIAKNCTERAINFDIKKTLESYLSLYKKLVIR